MDKIICVGKNFSAHAQEMREKAPENPMIFLKPPSCCVQLSRWEDRAKVELPFQLGSIHHECEIILRLKKGGFCVAESSAWDLVSDVSLGLDLTLRDLQLEFKKAGHPWTLSKCFKNSAIMAPWIPLDQFKNFLFEKFEFSINGDLKQSGKGDEMTHSPSKIISFASQYFPLSEGDIFFLGTPAGVGPLQPGDQIQLKWGKFVTGLSLQSLLT